MNTVIVIPTLNPSEDLVKLVQEIKKFQINKIVIIDDGSDSNKSLIFDKLIKEECKVIHHDYNRGKGKSLKDGIKYAYENFDNINGYVTADGDGQHLPKDIARVASLLEKNKCSNIDNLILGVRNFRSDNVPKRSKFGNKFSSVFFKFETGIDLEDTQTGLRGIPVNLTQLAINIDGDRYDYEMNFLVKVALEKIKIETIPIATVYEEKNKSSHFRTIQDSILIYKELVKFAVIAILSAVIDVGLFAFLNCILPISNFLTVAIATAIARITSGVFNFSANKKWSFESKNETKKEAIQYFALFIVQMIASSVLVSILSFLPINVTMIKVFVDLTIFFVNYFIERRFIFNK